MESLLRLVRICLIVGVLCFTGAILVGAIVIYTYSQELPKLDSLRDYNPPVVSEVYADDGTKIGEFWTEKRYVLAPNELPKTMVQAIVASEDDRFFEHKGIDYQGIIRAMFENVKAGHVVQGGSTITQQVTKSLLLTRERTITRKIKEAILATRIERNFDKDEILYLYLNQTFFGNRAYGIEAAAQNYFHKSAKELNIAEAAMIAGLAKAPSTFSPIANFNRAKIRQEYVIDRMLAEGFITSDQAKKAKRFSMKIYRAKTDKEFNYDYAPWFTEYIRRNLQKQYGENAPYTNGYRIYTTLNLPMQKAADRAVNRGLRELDQRQGYSGAIRKIPANSIGDFSEQNHIRILNESVIDKALDETPDPKLLANLGTPIAADKYYEAIVTGMDAKAETISVQVGTMKGTIRVHDYTWARKRNPNSVGYNGAYYLRNPVGTFDVGDVVLVKLKKASPEESKSKGYQEGSVYFSLEQTPKVEGALFSYEPSSGFVKAIVGGKDFKESEFNRAMQSIRQTGSAIKPLIYAAALDKGYTADTVINDSPIYYEYTPGKFWSPQNYGGDYNGPTTFRNALVNSRNVVTVKILMDIGTDYFTAYTRKLGVTTPIRRYYSMALGANDMKLYELCRAYGTFVTGGILPDLVFIKRMTDKTGKTVEEFKPRAIIPFEQQLEARGTEAKSNELRPDLASEGEKWIASEKFKLSESEKKILYGNYIPEGYAISPRTAYTMVQIMHDIVNHGTGYKVKELKRPAAGKTGTTNDETDTWFVGFVPDLFAGIWVGYDQVQKIGGKETGGKTSAPIFLYYMQEVLKDTEVAEFKIPEEINLSALDAPEATSEGLDAEAGGVPNTGGSADFFIHDF